MCMHVDYEIIFPDPTARAQKPPQATESPNDEPTCPAVQSTQITETGDRVNFILSKPLIHITGTTIKFCCDGAS